jgi:hypothetical protein
MKRISVLIIALVGLSLFVVSCKKDEGKKDAVAPIISLPGSDTLILDLGETDTALLNVKATDDVDGDLTKSIKLVANLETVGYTNLEYSVSDAANNKGTAVRPAIVRSNKLFGIYEVEATVVGLSGLNLYNITVTKSNSPTGLVIKKFNGDDYDVEFDLDADGKMKVVGTVEQYYDTKLCRITGEIEYAKVNGTERSYQITSITYTCTEAYPTNPDNPAISTIEGKCVFQK